MIEQVNARDQVTTSRYNALNQKVEQVDPVDCSATANMAAGNAPGKAATEHTPLAIEKATASHASGIVGWLRVAQRLVVAVMTAVSMPVSAQSNSNTSPAPKVVASPTTACTQTWIYDSESNVLSQVDRRGITTVNTYDRENRLLTHVMTQ